MKDVVKSSKFYEIMCSPDYVVGKPIKFPDTCKWLLQHTSELNSVLQKEIQEGNAINDGNDAVGDDMSDVAVIEKESVEPDTHLDAVPVATSRENVAPVPHINKICFSLEQAQYSPGHKGGKERKALEAAG